MTLPTPRYLSVCSWTSSIDNDFLPTVNGTANSNRFFVFAFGDEDLQSAYGDEAHAGRRLEPQIFEKK
jgi:hypothetical protein